MLEVDCGDYIIYFHFQSNSRMLKRFWKDYGSFRVVGRESIWSTHNSCSPSLCLCVVRQMFVVLALEANHSFIYPRITRINTLVSWEFMSLMPCISNIFLRYLRHGPWELGYLSVVCEWFETITYWKPAFILKWEIMHNISVLK